MKRITVYCDGGVVNNGKSNKDKDCYGSYCAVICNSKKNEPMRIFNEVFEDTTNNQMEIKGALVALDYLHEYMNKRFPKEKLSVTVISDSQYLVKGVNEWMSGWLKRNWKASDGKPVKNKDMWLKVIDCLNYKNLDIKFKWVRGHKGKSVSIEDDRDSYFNEMCDTILTESLAKYR